MEGVQVTKKKRRRAPPQAETPPPEDVPSSPPQSAAPEEYAPSPPPLERSPDRGTVGDREENQRLLGEDEEGGGDEARGDEPGYRVNEHSDEFRNVWD